MLLPDRLASEERQDTDEDESDFLSVREAAQESDILPVSRYSTIRVAADAGTIHDVVVAESSSPHCSAGQLQRML